MAGKTGDTKDTGAGSFNNTGKVKARDIIISTGLDEEAVKGYCDEQTQILIQEIKTQGHAVATETVRELRALVENRFVDFVCDLRAEQMSGEARIKEAVQNNFEELQNNTAALFKNFSAMLNGKLADGNSLHQAISALREKAGYYAEQHYTAMMRAFEELNRKVDRVQQGVDKVGGRLFKWDKQSETNYQRQMQYGHEALQTAQFDVAKGYFEEVTKSATVNDDMRADAYFGMALARWQVQLIWDDKKNSEQFIMYNYNNIKLSEKSSPYHEAIDNASKGQADKFRKFVSNLDFFREKLCYYRDRELSYDCFVCTKVSGDKKGTETEDYKWVKDCNLYNELKNRNISPFFSEIDCPAEGVKQGTVEYESLIYYALSRARIMLLVCSDEDYLETPWVANEVSRFRMFCKKRGEEPLSRIIVVHKDKPIELQSDLDVKYQGWNRSTFKVEEILRAVETAVENAKGNVEEGWKYCPKCGKQYPSNKVVCNEDKPCLNTPLVDALKWANISRNRECEKYQRIIEELEQKVKTLEESKVDLEKAKSALEKQKSGLEKQKSDLEKRFIFLESSLETMADKSIERKYIYYPTLENDNYNKTDFEIEWNVLKRYVGKATKVKIPFGVTSIGPGAFLDCSSLESIEIPDSVTWIEFAAFDGCSSLTIYCAAAEQPSGWDENWNPDNRPVVWGCRKVKKQ